MDYINEGWDKDSDVGKYNGVVENGDNVFGKGFVGV